MKRRDFIKGLLAAASTTVLPAAHAASPVIDVYKTETCGCCIQWVEHLEANGFKVNVNNVPDTAPYRQKYGIPQKLGSCHTGVVQGYAIEGHVPAREIKRLLKERPKATGLAVPGMPIGSPGMEVEGRPADKYDVVLVQANGKHSVYQQYQ
ncbi:DUF411 domain-containing protein [Noviherbaspirillum sp.]|uniref:DUF411 domain-containing protein n=1 Tax=Noviherbaspirillum sp. TaxID=1926288 RepID=UPI002FE128E1